MARVSPVASTTLRLPRQRSLYLLVCTSRLSRDSTASRGPALSTGCSMARCPSRPVLPPATLHKQAALQRPEIVPAKRRCQGLELQRRHRQDPEAECFSCGRPESSGRPTFLFSIVLLFLLSLESPALRTHIDTYLW